MLRKFLIVVKFMIGLLFKGTTLIRDDSFIIMYELSKFYMFKNFIFILLNFIWI